MNHDQIEKAKAYLKTQYESLKEINCLDDSTKKILSDTFNLLKQCDDELWKAVEDSRPMYGREVIVFANGKQRLSTYRSREEWRSQGVTHWKSKSANPEPGPTTPRPPQGAVEHDVSYDEATFSADPSQVYRFAVADRADAGFIPLPFEPDNNPANGTPTDTPMARSLYQRMREENDRIMRNMNTNPFVLNGTDLAQVDLPDEMIGEPINTATAPDTSGNSNQIPPEMRGPLHINSDRPMTWTEWFNENAANRRRTT